MMKNILNGDKSCEANQVQLEKQYRDDYANTGGASGFWRSRLCAEYK